MLQNKLSSFLNLVNLLKFKTTIIDAQLFVWFNQQTPSTHDFEYRKRVTASKSGIFVTSVEKKARLFLGLLIKMM